MFKITWTLNIFSQFLYQMIFFENYMCSWFYTFKCIRINFHLIFFHSQFYIWTLSCVFLFSLTPCRISTVVSFSLIVLLLHGTALQRSYQTGWNSAGKCFRTSLWFFPHRWLTHIRRNGIRYIYNYAGSKAPDSF